MKRTCRRQNGTEKVDGSDRPDDYQREYRHEEFTQRNSASAELVETVEEPHERSEREEQKNTEQDQNDPPPGNEYNLFKSKNKYRLQAHF